MLIKPHFRCLFWINIQLLLLLLLLLLNDLINIALFLFSIALLFANLAF